MSSDVYDTTNEVGKWREEHKDAWVPIPNHFADSLSARSSFLT